MGVSEPAPDAEPFRQPQREVPIAAKVGSAAAFGAFFHQGQICFTIGRHLVHESVAGDYARILGEKAAALHVGNPATEQVHLGPIVNETQAARAQDIYDRTLAMGAEAVVAGGRDGTMFKPAVVKGVTRDMPLFKEEIFGPVAPITTFATEDEAIELANAVEYGLATSIFTADLARAARIADRVRTGIVHVNDQTLVHEVFGPIGGMGASGNGARSGGPSMADEYSQWQWVTVSADIPGYPF
ncbi:aldehyde dehydrogenase family protein [Amaricoccus sp.]|uniref:aldehyde dehydrogenase family protein n=1 Tax=Amaricoccus sp. TaxID=1872485 RepID=UPI001B6F247A|nr:aldehyde dehydrogenase family protein [Amaricoccus sp.]MBP7002171.1 aldehyde dehydrogenase family protein [Amaricoccus sp.]